MFGRVRWESLPLFHAHPCFTLTRRLPLMPAEVPAKAAAADHDLLDAIRYRWSPRAFSERPVEEEKLRSLLEAARWAASSYNEQPWRFLLATKQDPEAYDRLLGCLNEKNRKWARTAPALMLSFAKKTFSQGDKANRHAWHDVGLAMGNLLMQATVLGLYAHQMAGILPEEIRATYDAPDDFEPVAGVALGYLGDPSVLPEGLQEKERAPRSRRPLGETVFGEAWGEAVDLVR